MIRHGIQMVPKQTAVLPATASAEAELFASPYNQFALLNFCVLLYAEGFATWACDESVWFAV